MATLDYPDVEVELVRHTIAPEQLIEWAGRVCWDKQDSPPTPNRIRKWIKVGHESMLEHASMTFWIRASRILTHELVRHRIASYSQRSQRYVRENQPKYITPSELQGDPLSLSAFNEAMIHCWSAYGKLLSLGVNPEIARYVLPGACETQIVMTMNLRELRHFIKLRSSAAALPEMRVVAGEIKEICKMTCPQVFEDL